MTTSNPVQQGLVDAERKLVEDGMALALREGDNWYLIDSEWFAKWKLYVDFDNQFRGSRSVQVNFYSNTSDSESNTSLFILYYYTIPTSYLSPLLYFTGHHYDHYHHHLGGGEFEATCH